MAEEGRTKRSTAGNTVSRWFGRFLNRKTYLGWCSGSGKGRLSSFRRLVLFLFGMFAVLSVLLASFAPWVAQEQLPVYTKVREEMSTDGESAVEVVSVDIARPILSSFDQESLHHSNVNLDSLDGGSERNVDVRLVFDEKIDGENFSNPQGEDISAADVDAEHDYSEQSSGNEDVQMEGHAFEDSIGTYEEAARDTYSGESARYHIEDSSNEAEKEVESFDAVGNEHSQEIIPDVAVAAENNAGENSIDSSLSNGTEEGNNDGSGSESGANFKQLVLSPEGMLISSQTNTTFLRLRLEGIDEGRTEFPCALKYGLWHNGAKVTDSAELQFKAPGLEMDKHASCTLIGYEAKDWSDTWMPNGGPVETASYKALHVKLHWSYPLGWDKANEDLTLHFMVFESAIAIRSELPQGSRLLASHDLYNQMKIAFHHLTYEGAVAKVFADLGNERGFAANDVNMPFNYASKWLTSSQVSPITVINPDPYAVKAFALTITEACVMNTRNMIFSQLEPGKGFATGVNLIFQRRSSMKWESSENFKMPWYVLMLGRHDMDLLRKQIQLGILCDLPEEKRYEYKKWAKEGKVLRDVRLSTNSIETLANYAPSIGAKYILLDAGWYGKETDPKSDPLKPLAAPKGQSLDIPKSTEIAAEKDVGLVLYVNDIALKQNAKNIIEQLAKWGVVGIKMGFVHVGTSSDMERILSYVVMCAKNRIVVNIHDDYREYGLFRTFPHLLSVEGIRGDEHLWTPFSHFCTLPFTRFVGGGRADYTFTLDYDRLGNQGRSIMAQIALPFIYHNGLQHINWYLVPEEMMGRGTSDVLSLWKKPLTSWLKTEFVTGQIGEYICIARKSSDGEWFMAGIANSKMKMTLSSDFLSTSEQYVATLYHGSRAQTPQLETEKPHVEPLHCSLVAKETFKLPVGNSSGFVMLIRPGSISDLPTCASLFDEMEMELANEPYRKPHEGWVSSLKNLQANTQTVVTSKTKTKRKTMKVKKKMKIKKKITI